MIRLYMTLIVTILLTNPSTIVAQYRAPQPEQWPYAVQNGGAQSPQQTQYNAAGLPVLSSEHKFGQRNQSGTQPGKYPPIESTYGNFSANQAANPSGNSSGALQISPGASSNRQNPFDARPQFTPVSQSNQFPNQASSQQSQQSYPQQQYTPQKRPVFGPASYQQPGSQNQVPQTPVFEEPPGGYGENTLVLAPDEPDDQYPRTSDVLPTGQQSFGQQPISQQPRGWNLQAEEQRQSPEQLIGQPVSAQLRNGQPGLKPGMQPYLRQSPDVPIVEPGDPNQNFLEDQMILQPIEQWNPGDNPVTANPEKPRGPIFMRDSNLITTAVGNGGLGLINVHAKTSLGLSSTPQFSITPGFEYTNTSPPALAELPSNLYSAYLTFSWLQPPGAHSQWGYQLALTPSFYSDFDNTSGDAYRILGRAIGFYASSPALQYVFGVVYLDRENLPVLPAFGAIWSPSEDTRLELIFPRPKASYRLRNMPDSETWLYLAGEFGGGSWAVQRQTTGEDVLTYSDWRLLAGFEAKVKDSTSYFFEAGYVFNREVEYESNFRNFDPNSTWLLRIGFSR